MTLLNHLFKFLRGKFAVVGVPAIIVNSKKQILLGKRSSAHVFYPGFWGLPGGLVESNETLEQAVKRELKEELGASVKIIKRSKNIYEHLPNKFCFLHIIDIPFFCKLLNKPLAKQETSLIKWFSPQEIKKLKLAYSHKKILEKEGVI